MGERRENGSEWGLDVDGRKSGCVGSGPIWKVQRKSVRCVSTRESPGRWLGTTPNEYTQSWRKVCYSSYSGHWLADQQLSCEDLTSLTVFSCHYLQSLVMCVSLIDIHSSSSVQSVGACTRMGGNDPPAPLYFMPYRTGWVKYLLAGTAVSQPNQALHATLLLQTSLFSVPASPVSRPFAQPVR